MWYSIEPRTRKHNKAYGFFPLSRIYWKQLLDAGLDALKTASKILVHKAAEGTGEFIRNKIIDKIAKQKHVIDEKSKKCGKIIIPPEKGEQILNELK